MTRILKTSGFLGLMVMMSVGLHQSTIIASGQTVPPWMIGGHAHLGVLSILAIVLGFAIESLGVIGWVRSIVTGFFVVGQWALPVTVWLAAGAGLGFLHPTTFLWGVLLIISMALMAWQAAVQSKSFDEGAGPQSATPADD